MAAAHETILFDVHDFKVYPMTSDTGASPVYESPIDVYGIAEVGLDPNFVTAELKGDGKVIAKKGKMDRLNGSATYGRLSGDVLDALIDSTTADVSATRARTKILAGQSMPYWGASFVIEDADNGIEDVVVVLFKAQMTGGSLLGQSSDNFGQPSFEWEAIGLAATDFEDWMADINFYTEETGVPAGLPVY
jgi:hypothetical protein